MTQITVAYSGVAFVAAPDSQGNLALPALGQAGFNFSAVPAGSALQIASVRVAGSWSGTDTTIYNSALCAVLAVTYGSNSGLGLSQRTTLYANLPYSAASGPDHLVFGTFDTTASQDTSGTVSYMSYCPQQAITLAVLGAPLFAQITLAGMSFTIAHLEVTFNVLSGGCGSWTGGTGTSGGGGGTNGGTMGTGTTGGDPSLCQLKLTRPNLRDAIRSQLGITPPIQYIQGAAAGEEPAGETWPGNFNINQAIADAIRELNRRTGFHSTHALSVNVAAYTGVGPQWVPLQGIGAGPWQNLINDVQRAIWDDGNGNLTRLRTRSFDGLDRGHAAFDTYTADTPREFGIHGYEMGLLPGSANGGTLHLWAGTGLIGFCSDLDVIDELSLDEQAVIETLAVKKLRMMRPDEENAVAQIELFGRDSEQGIKDIRRNLAHRSAQEQSFLTVTTRRRRRWV